MTIRNADLNGECPFYLFHVWLTMVHLDKDRYNHNDIVTQLPVASFQRLS